MKIAFILHDFSLTGAPKIGLDIASILSRRHTVSLVSKKDGPLRAFAEKAGLSDVAMINTSHETSRLSLSSRVELYEDYLKRFKPDLVYINSLAAADWASACYMLEIPFLVHVHEMRSGIRALAVEGIYSIGDIRHANLVLSASEECGRDARDELLLGSRSIVNFGVSIDCAAVARKSLEEPAKAVNARKTILADTPKDGRTRPLIAMCGQSCLRKGSDMFWELALRVPECDFLWVGPWDDDTSKVVNPALAMNSERPLDNLYWTGLLANPYSSIVRADLFMLTAREDPNPLVVPEALSLGVPVCSFVNTGGSRFWTERYGFSLAGAVSTDRMESFLRKLLAQTPLDAQPTAAFFEEADIEGKVQELLQEIEAVLT
ncbi:hypothetical protein LWE61_17825 [Sphingobium sufflavum]|uniref:hypothetical protein n=1 Tax=Sphingobium sufflavum TaxID=1129547 RepID=UPI001F25B859|nr:hypothetical protein [Sphingobium sufflavum]MCE7798400.1 hypothetical protein [Sphingobium sufflavum]